MQSFWLFNREITEIGDGSHFFIFSLSSYLLIRFGLRRTETSPSQKSKIVRRIDLKWLQIWSIQFFCALCFSGAIVQITKVLIGRQRPHKSPLFENQIFSPLSFHWDWHSFPSGHSQTLFTVFVFLGLLWPKKKWLLFALFSYLSLTRAFTQAHFLSDVVCGAFFGYAGALLVLNYFESRARLS